MDSGFSRPPSAGAPAPPAEALKLFSVVIPARDEEESLPGTVRESHVQPGDHVRRGQLLAVLDDRGAQAQAQGAAAGVSEATQGEAEVDQALKAATADREYAEATYNRYKVLLAKNSLSQQEFEGAEARYHSALANERSIEAKKQQIAARQQQARSQQDSAQTFLSYARIISPLDGIVTAKSVDVGTVVMPGTPVLTVDRIQVVK